MIGWIYSVAGSWRVVTLSYQKFSEGTKTIVDTSNRSRVVSNVVCDDFMQLERPLGAERVPSRLAVLPQAPEFVDRANSQQRAVSPVTKS